jgi:hypothetical protein
MMQNSKFPTFQVARNYTDYLLYKDIKRDLDIHYKGINMVDVCAVDLINAIVLRQNETWYHVGCTLIQRVNLQPLLHAFVHYKNIFSFEAVGRKDHEELSHAIAESVEESAWVRIEYIYRPDKIVSRGLYFWWKVRNLPTSFVNKAYLAARMAGYSCVVDQLMETFQNVSLEGKNYIPFCSPIYHEALFTLFFRQRGVKTYCTFHGMFGRYMHQITNDVVNGENIHTDRVLTFGETPRYDLIHDFGVDPDKISVAGNPKYSYHPILLKNTYTSCLILGGTGSYDKELRELLLTVEEIAKHSKISFALKPHPRSNIQNDNVWKQLAHIRIIEKDQTIQSLFESNGYDFAITHNTTSYYECFIYGLKPFRWATNENLNFDGLDDRFVNEEQLLEKIEKASKTSTEILSQEVEILLKNVLGYGVNRYNQYINE